MNPTVKRLKSLLRPSRHEVKGPMILLFASGWGGAWYWPPPGQEIYKTLVDITSLEGPAGCMVRMLVALLIVLGWLLPSTFWRCVLYIPAILSCALISFAFYDVGHGFGAFAWGSMFIIGLRTIDAERSAYVDELDASRVEAAAFRGVERAVAHVGERPGHHALN